MRNSLTAWLCGVVFLTASAAVSAQTFNVLRSFSGSPSPFPFGRLLTSSNALYGTTMGGGTYGYGSVFRVKTDGTDYTMLKSFPQTYVGPSGASTNSDGAAPLAGLVLGGDTLYGTANEGGTGGMGIVYSLKTDGTEFTVLKQFSGPDGKAPYAELVLSSNVLYGTTAAGGDSNKGAVFRLNTDGSDFALLKSFAISDGLLPLGGLALSGRTLYGTTYEGGVSNCGTIFSLHTDGTGFAILKEFTGADGSRPRFTPVLSGDSLYGATEGDSDLSRSLVFKLNTNGTDYTILKTFPTPDPISGTNIDGYYVRSGLASAGSTLFGTTDCGGYFGSGVIFALRLDGSAYTVLKHFSATTDNGSGALRNSDGASPLPSLIQSAGTLYGTTQYGGSAGSGTLFSLNVAPQIQVIDGSFGPQTNGFGFNIIGCPNQIAVVESCVDLATGSWSPVQTNTIADSPVYFVDPNWTNYPTRLYRIRAE